MFVLVRRKVWLGKVYADVGELIEMDDADAQKLIDKGTVDQVQPSEETLAELAGGEPEVQPETEEPVDDADAQKPADEKPTDTKTDTKKNTKK